MNSNWTQAYEVDGGGNFQVSSSDYMNAGQMTDYLSQHGHMEDIGSSLGL